MTHKVCEMLTLVLRWNFGHFKILVNILWKQKNPPVQFCTVRFCIVQSCIFRHPVGSYVNQFGLCNCEMLVS